MNDQVAHIHFEKANPEIRGLYQAINRDFILHEFADTEFVNREEDLGVPGLRQAKMEYNPDHFAEKYNVVLQVPWASKETSGEVKQDAVSKSDGSRP